MKLNTLIFTALLALTTTPALAETGATVQNTSGSRGFWVTTYKDFYGIQRQLDSGCVEPGDTVIFSSGDIVRIQVTSDAKCQQQTICDTRFASHPGPVSVYPDDHGGCYIDYVINHEGDPGYKIPSLGSSDVPDNML